MDVVGRLNRSQIIPERTIAVELVCQLSVIHIPNPPKPSSCLLCFSYNIFLRYDRKFSFIFLRIFSYFIIICHHRYSWQGYYFFPFHIL